MKKELGLYVHIPFCVKKCGYCDFLSWCGTSEEKETYVQALLKEIESYREFARGYRVSTVFVGGGTPSVLEAGQMERVLGNIQEVFELEKKPEITLEMNPGTVTEEMVRNMAEKPILFPMANPTPEIMPDLAKNAGAAVVGTGRSDFPNQINNVLAFPGIFRGALDVRAKDINDEMKVAAAYAIADIVSPEELNPDYILPAAFDPRVAPAVAKAVAEAARKSGVARI